MEHMSPWNIDDEDSDIHILWCLDLCSPMTRAAREIVVVVVVVMVVVVVVVVQEEGKESKAAELVV